MRYAVISDIHGNMPALQAVLNDAKNKCADRYIFLGDYYMNLPFPNEVIDTIRSVGHFHIIKGNEEDHIERLSKQNQENWTDGQFSALYWTYRTLTKDNRRYLSALPAKEIINDAGTHIYTAHSSKAHFHHTVLDNINSRDFALNNQRNMDFIHGILNTDEHLQNSLSALPDGIYLFGHTHLQFHKKMYNKLLLNPGSCGLPLDRIQGAPYTMIDILSGDWQVNEYRVLYDLDETIQRLKQSELYHRGQSLE